MTRFAFTLLLLLAVVGCQTAAHSPQPTARSKQFLARLLQPLKPDSGKHPAETESLFALHHPQTAILPINHTSHPLYQSSSIFPSPLLLSHSAEHETAIHTAATRSNPLQLQEGDSKAFQSLLREIAVVPADEWKVDDTKLAELLTSFRDDVMNSDVETEYLVLLRKRILPETESSAPLPKVDIAAAKPARRHPVFEQEFDWDEEDWDEPLERPVAKKPPPGRAEPIIAQRPAPRSEPVYPSLPQIPTASPAVTQASYNAPYVPNPATTGYGAGDWQTPTRQAIDQLRYAIAQSPPGSTMSNEMRLRTLEMLLGNRTEAARPIVSADASFNKFMANHVLGFSDLLDDTVSESRGKYGSAAYRFNEGLLELQYLCPLKLKTVKFVTDYFDFGQYMEHPTCEFHPGENFLVYMELENPTVRPLADGFAVSVAISYEIRDTKGNIVDKQDAGSPAEKTLTRKRDYRLGLGPCKLPTSLSPGEYRLRIAVSDLNDTSVQYAEEMIPFRIAPSSGTDL